MPLLEVAIHHTKQLLRMDLRTMLTCRVGFRTSSASLAAQNFTMPALSPTMTEGNIAKWNIKEGDSFTAGDVLLEIETDKASMDVEAQDDGVLAKIIQGDGSKGIPVGTRIGVLADQGDDLASLEIPAEEGSSAPKKEPKSESAPAEPKKSESSEESAPADKPAKKSSSSSGPSAAQTYPFFPSIEALLREHNLSHSDVAKMTPSGPKGRLIKGDVLAYLGLTSSESYATDLAKGLEKLSHLDLSNIKISPPKPKASKVAAEAAPEPAKVEITDVAVQISMKAVLEVQKRIQSSLGVFLPISTFINRAVDLANDDLPLPKNYQPSADELFNQVLGLDKVVTQQGTRGSFIPQISAFPPTAPAQIAKPKSKKVDILDQLIGGGKKSAFSKASKSVPGLSSGENVFSVTVPKGDEKRAGLFLERVKVVLEGEPGRLVI